MAIAGRVARITTVVVAGCGEIADGPASIPASPSMLVEIDATSFPPPPIDVAGTCAMGPLDAGSVDAGTKHAWIGACAER